MAEEQHLKARQIDAERINILDQDGTLRMAISTLVKTS